MPLVQIGNGLLASLRSARADDCEERLLQTVEAAASDFNYPRPGFVTFRSDSDPGCQWRLGPGFPDSLSEIVTGGTA